MYRNTLLTAGIVVLLLATGWYASAQEETAEPQESKKIEIDIDLIDLQYLREIVEESSSGEEVRLTISDCVEMALHNNQDIIVDSYEPLKADGDIMAAHGEFDPILQGQANYSEAEAATSSDLESIGGITAVESYLTTGQAQLGGKLKWGTQYGVSFDVKDEETTFNNFREKWTGNLGLSLTQPLLRGRGAAINLTRIRQSETARDINSYQLELTVLNTIADVVKSYWDLVGAHENLRVREESLANAERLLAISEKRLEIGTAAAIEVLQSKAGVAMRQSDLIAARSTVSDAEDVLKQALGLRSGDALSPARLFPVDRPETVLPDLEELRVLENSTDNAIAQAYDNRPEVKMAQLSIDNAEREARYLHNGMLPQLDVVGTVSTGGTGHFPSQMLTGIREQENNAYSIGVVGSIPFGNRAAKGSYHRAEKTWQQAEQRLVKTKQDLALQVRLALRQVVTSRILVESNTQTRKLQEANVAAEEKRLKLGVTTSYRVLQIQEDLTAAQTQEVQARTNYEKAVTDFQLAQGTLLNTLGVEFIPPEE